ncbi:MAG: peptidylprolyl isomerase, partial [Pseudomonadota bacterium]
MKIPTALLLAALCLNAAAQSTESPMARVNGRPIPRSALDRAIEQAKAAGQADTSELRQELVERLVADELLWQEARKAGHGRAPEVAAAAEAARRQAAVERYLKAAVRVAEPTEADIRRRYDAIVASLGPREYRLSLIQAPHEAVVRAAAEEISGGADFAAVARRVSRAPSAARGGELDWLSFPLPPTAGRTNGLPLPVAQAVAKLAMGEVSPPIPLEGGGWALVRLDARRPTLIPPYEQVRATLRQALLAQATAAASRDFVAELMKRARI